MNDQLCEMFEKFLDEREQEVKNSLDDMSGALVFNRSLYNEISLIKIFENVEDQMCLQFVMKNGDTFHYIVKQEHYKKKAFGRATIENHLDCDYAYYAQNLCEEEMKHIDDLVSWSDYDDRWNWKGYNL